MSTSLPTADQAQALHKFIQDRTEEEWQRARADDDLPLTALEGIRRLANSNKLAVGGTTAYLLACLAQRQYDQATRLWDYLTSCGEEWQDHPDWKREWANPARAALR